MIIIDKGLITAHIACHTQVVEWHEDAIRAHEAKPEMYFAQSLVHHSPGHLGEPEVGSGEDPENCRHRHHHVEVSHHEIGRVQHDVDRGLRQKKAADAAADEHGNEAQSEQ